MFSPSDHASSQFRDPCLTPATGQPRDEGQAGSSPRWSSVMHCKMQIANLQFAFCNLHFAISWSDLRASSCIEYHACRLDALKKVGVANRSEFNQIDGTSQELLQIFKEPP